MNSIHTRGGGYWLDYGELGALLKENRLCAPGKTGKTARRIFVNLEVVRFIHTVKIRKLPSPAGQNVAGAKTAPQRPDAPTR